MMNLVLSYSHRELPNDPDNPVPARVRAPLAAIRETRLVRYPLLGRTVSDEVALRQLAGGFQTGLDIARKLRVRKGQTSWE